MRTAQLAWLLGSPARVCCIETFGFQRTRWSTRQVPLPYTDGAAPVAIVARSATFEIPLGDSGTHIKNRIFQFGALRALAKRAALRDGLRRGTDPPELEVHQAAAQEGATEFATAIVQADRDQESSVIARIGNGLS